MEIRDAGEAARAEQAHTETHGECMGRDPSRAARRPCTFRMVIALSLVILVLGAVVVVARFGGPYAVAAMSPVLTQLNRLVRTVTQG
jgi:hypothetical protein